MTTHQRGEVVWYPALFADYDRPFLLISTDRHPYHGVEYIGLSITTSEIAEALPIEVDAWVIGDLPEASYVKPWNPVIIKEDTIRSVAGVLSSSFVDEAVANLIAICGGPPS